MSNKTPKPRSRGPRTSADDRHRRHLLELVTDTWIAELAEVVVMPRRTGNDAAGRQVAIARAADRERRPGVAPLRPA